MGNHQRIHAWIISRRITSCSCKPSRVSCNDLYGLCVRSKTFSLKARNGPSARGGFLCVCVCDLCSRDVARFPRGGSPCLCHLSSCFFTAVDRALFVPEPTQIYRFLRTRNMISVSSLI